MRQMGVRSAPLAALLAVALVVLCGSGAPVAAGVITYGTCAPYESDGGSVTTCTVFLKAHQQFSAGTCTVPGSSGDGDTYLTLKFNGVTVTLNDDYCGRLSYFTTSVSTTGYYVIEQKCFSTGSCSGTTAWMTDGADCSDLTDCLGCRTNSTCGWCGTSSGSGTCRAMGGNATANYRPASCPATTYTWSQSQCTPLPSCSTSSSTGTCASCLSYDGQCKWCSGSASYSSTYGACISSSASCASTSYPYVRSDSAQCSSCYAYTDCSTCTLYSPSSSSSSTSTSGCVWCHATGQCMSVTSGYDQCRYGLSTTCSTAVCSTLHTCASCVNAPNCGWSNSSFTCLSGNQYGPAGMQGGASAPSWWMTAGNNTCAADPPTSSSTSSKLSTGAIVGIAVGGAAFAIMCCACSIASQRRKRAAHDAAAAQSRQNAGVVFSPNANANANANASANGANGAMSPVMPQAPAMNAPPPQQQQAPPQAVMMAPLGFAGDIACPYCNWRNPPNYAFCSSCGRRLGAGGFAPGMQPAMAQPMAMQQMGLPPGMQAYAVPQTQQYGAPPPGYAAVQYAQQQQPLPQAGYAAPPPAYGAAVAGAPVALSGVAPVVDPAGAEGSSGNSREAAPSVVAPPPAFNPNAPPAGAAGADAGPAAPGGLGAGVGRVCGACQLLNEPGYTFCSRCASPLTETGAGSPPTFGA